MSDPFDLLDVPATLVPLRQNAGADDQFRISQVVVTGMHRSGTSAVTQLLGTNGCDLGDPSQLLPADPANPLGYFENVDLYTLNESLLDGLNACWWHPPSLDTVAQNAEEMARTIKPHWRAIRQSFSGVPIVKDPRLSLLLPAWGQVFGRGTLYVVCMRDPLATARSLLARNQIDLRVGCALWEVYTIALLRGLTGTRAIFVDVDALSASQPARLELVNLVRVAADLPPTSTLSDTFDLDLLSTAAADRELIDILTGYQLALLRSLSQLPRDVVVVDDLSHLRTTSSALRLLESNFQLANEREATAAEIGQLRRDSDEARSAVELATAAQTELQEQIQGAAAAQAKSREQLANAAETEAGLRRELKDTTLSETGLRRRIDTASETEAGLRQQLEVERIEVQRLSITIQELQAALAETLDDDAQREAANRNLQQRLDERDAAVAAMSMEIDRLNAATTALEAARARATAEAQATHDLYAAAFTSRSWRWTKPLRREGSGAPTTPLTGDETAADDLEPERPGVGELVEPAPGRIAVVVHMFYADLWEPAREQLANLQQPFDLFVSLTEGHSEHLAALINEQYPAAVVRIGANRGRDIAPFVEFIRSGQLDGYTAILKLHSKRSHHRMDGDEWRTALWHGLLPSPINASRFAAIVAGHPDVGCIVPAGNVLSVESIGSNADRLTALLGRVGLDFRPEELRFPAGSMYWLDGTLVELIKAIFVAGIEDFEPEEGQADGTTAHAFERLLGVLLQRRGQLIVASEDAPSIPNRPDWMGTRAPKVLAFYLPQFHRTPENDNWWGDGFTDWTNVATAAAWHADQRFPRAPTQPLGQYDLSVDDVPAAQYKLARKYGIDGFLVYHYWFSGRRLLNEPMDRVLGHPEWDFPYALVWANESWTRTWDGLDNDVLIAQTYEAGWEAGLLDSMLPHLRDPRYLRLAGKPLLVLFKPSMVPDLAGSIQAIRKHAAAAGIDELHIAGVLHQRHVPGAGSAMSDGIDSWIEFPPLSGPTPTRLSSVMEPDGSERGVVYDYRDLVDQRHFAPSLDGCTVHPGAMPSWDNTPRRKHGASSFANANPADFRRWLADLRRGLAGLSSPHENLVCINAWNEWAETAHLEPDDRLGLANLEAIGSVFGFALDGETHFVARGI